MVPQISCTGCRDSSLLEARRITAQAGHILALHELKKTQIQISWSPIFLFPVSLVYGLTGSDQLTSAQITSHQIRSDHLGSPQTGNSSCGMLMRYGYAYGYKYAWTRLWMPAVASGYMVACGCLWLLAVNWLPVVASGCLGLFGD